jgi:metal-responsive CopG/Arc/MetJ family transcriptional regulator
MKSLSLKLKEDILKETEELLGLLKKNRNAYINEALRHYNLVQKRRLLAIELEAEARMASASSLEVLREMEQLDDELP